MGEGGRRGVSRVDLRADVDGLVLRMVRFGFFFEWGLAGLKCVARWARSLSHRGLDCGRLR